MVRIVSRPRVSMTILIAVGVRIARLRIRLTEAEQSRLSLARQIEQRLRGARGYVFQSRKGDQYAKRESTVVVATKSEK